MVSYLGDQNTEGMYGMNTRDKMAIQQLWFP